MNTVDIEITLQLHGRRKRHGEISKAAIKLIPRMARLMALAIKFRGMVDGGEVRDYAEIARLGYVSRARVTQIMNLLMLAPDIQEQLLFLEGSTAQPRERQLRPVMLSVAWAEQRASWRKIVSAPFREGADSTC